MGKENLRMGRNSVTGILGKYQKRENRSGIREKKFRVKVGFLRSG